MRLEQLLPTQLTIDSRPLTSPLILRNEYEAETEVDVTVARVVVATNRDTAVPRVVDPTTTTKDAVRA